MKLTDEQMICERVGILEEALAKCLSIDSSMEVYVSESGGGRCVWVRSADLSDARIGHNLREIARELERLLS